jgi:hypothetical protein
MKCRSPEYVSLPFVLFSHPPYLYGLPPQNKKGLRTLCQKACELVHKYVFYLVRLLYLYAYPHAVDTGLNEDLLVLVPRHGERVEEHFGRAGSFDLGHIVSFRGLGCKIGEGEGGRERRADALEVRAE